MKREELTPRLAVKAESEYDSHDKWKGVGSLSYMVTKSVSLLAQYHSDFGWGGGIQWQP